MARTSDEDPNELTESERRTEALAKVLSKPPSHTCSQPSFGYPHGKSFDCPACIAERAKRSESEEGPSLLGCTGAGGVHSDGYVDPDDGLCQRCGLVRAGSAVAERMMREQRGYVPLPLALVPASTEDAPTRPKRELDLDVLERAMSRTLKLIRHPEDSPSPATWARRLTKYLQTIYTELDESGEFERKT